MMPLLRGSLLAATLLAAAVPARVLVGDSLSSAEREALRARADASLEALRGGLVADAAIADDERAILAAAEAATPDLQDERAAFGGLSERDLIIIACTVVAIAVLIIIF